MQTMSITDIRMYPTAEDSTGVSDPQAMNFINERSMQHCSSKHQLIWQFQGVAGLWTNIENLTIEGDMPLGPNSITTGIAGYAYEEYLADEKYASTSGVRYDVNRIQRAVYRFGPIQFFQVLDVARRSNAVTASVGAIEKVTQELTDVEYRPIIPPPTVQDFLRTGSTRQVLLIQ